MCVHRTSCRADLTCEEQSDAFCEENQQAAANPHDLRNGEEWCRLTIAEEWYPLGIQVFIRAGGRQDTKIAVRIDHRIA